VDWSGFRGRFLQDDGRLVDTGNAGISHSEGQGTGLLLAAAADDREAFARIWRWTQATLRRPEDGLFSWRFEPQRGVTDRNNASDGDLLIAWGLLRGARRWREPSYLAAAQDAAAAVRRQLVVQHAGRTLLLPGLEGFRAQDGSLTVNPSYLVLPAMRAFDKAGFKGRWDLVGDQSVRFLRDVRFGPYDLPIDWVRVDPTGAIWAESTKPPRFGFDALRAPLYLKWGGYPSEPAVRAAARWWRTPRPNSAPPPAWVDVTTGVVADYPVSPGALAVASYVIGAPIAPPPATADYYATALWNLAALAASES
jgi:endo-1,4-beta-D-glucanase Y